MLAEFYIPRLSNHMKMAVQKNYLGGQILYKSLDGDFVRKPKKSEICIEPNEDVEEWFSRIAKDGKFSTLQVESFERLVTEVSDNYSHARFMPEPYNHRHLDTLRVN